MSGAHALILVDRGRAYIRDLGSRTHLFVNHLPVREAELRQRDVIRVGAFNFAFAEGDSVGPSPATAEGVPKVGLHVAGEAHPRLMTGPVVLVGDHDGCDLILSPDSSDWAHVAVFYTRGRWHVRDLGSQTAKAVNDVPLKRQHTLTDGDTIRVDSTLIRFVESTAPPAGSPADPALDTDLPEATAQGEGTRLVNVDAAPEDDAPSLPTRPTADARPITADLGTSEIPDAPAPLVELDQAPVPIPVPTNSKIRSIASEPPTQSIPSASVPLFMAVTEPVPLEVEVAGETTEEMAEGSAPSAPGGEFEPPTASAATGEDEDRAPSAVPGQLPTVWGFSELTRRVGAPPPPPPPLAARPDIHRFRPVGTRKQLVAVVVICLVCVLLVGILVARQIW